MSEKLKKYNNKCDECGGAMCPYVYKGRNNNYLCGGTWYNKGCGQNICFVCGKKEEEKFRWEEYGKDCRGNKEMVKVATPMFSQFERDENDPDRKLNVLYCEEHKQEALKSPLKWTEENTEGQKRREEERKIQEEHKREEKLNNQKNLFFLDGLVDKKSGSEGGRRFGDYGFFLGRQNGQNYYLVIPFDHPIWKNETDPAIKKATENFRWDGNQDDFFIIKGVENIPIEKCPTNYWKGLSNKKEPIFHKIVGLNDKITITLGDIDTYIKRLQRLKSGCENSLENIQAGKWHPKMDKEIPSLKKMISEYEEKIQYWLSKNDKSSPTLLENHFPNYLPKELNDKTLLEYFQKNNVKSIKLENNQLIIEYNNKQEKETKEIKNDETQQIKLFAEKLGKSELTLSDLEQSNNQSNVPKSNKGLYIGLAIVGVLAVGAIIWLLIRNKKYGKK